MESDWQAAKALGSQWGQHSAVLASIAYKFMITTRMQQLCHLPDTALVNDDKASLWRALCPPTTMIPRWSVYWDSCHTDITECQDRIGCYFVVVSFLYIILKIDCTWEACMTKICKWVAGHIKGAVFLGKIWLASRSPKYHAESFLLLMQGFANPFSLLTIPLTRNCFSACQCLMKRRVSTNLCTVCSNSVQLCSAC